MTVVISALSFFAIAFLITFRVQVRHASQIPRAIPVKAIKTNYGRMTHAEKGTGISVLIAHDADKRSRTEKTVRPDRKNENT